MNITGLVINTILHLQVDIFSSDSVVDGFRREAVWWAEDKVYQCPMKVQASIPYQPIQYNTIPVWWTEDKVYQCLMKVQATVSYHTNPSNTIPYQFSGMTVSLSMFYEDQVQCIVI